MLMQLVVTFQHLFPHQVSERIQTMGDEAMSPILPQGSPGFQERHEMGPNW